MSRPISLVPFEDSCCSSHRKELRLLLCQLVWHFGLPSSEDFDRTNAVLMLSDLTGTSSLHYLLWDPTAMIEVLIGELLLDY